MNSLHYQTELPFSGYKTYLWAGAFVLANVLLPQCFHAIPGAGRIFLPLFFFTLLASVRFGWKAGVITAVCSPLFSTLVFGMPIWTVLPVLMLKGVLLSAVAALIFRNAVSFSWIRLASVILLSQLLGFASDALFFSAFADAWTTVQLSWPGLLSQWIIGGCILKYWVSNSEQNESEEL